VTKSMTRTCESVEPRVQATAMTATSKAAELRRRAG
jgi:hypothetical protein